jgi:hypothetical protein
MIAKTATAIVLAAALAASPLSAASAHDRGHGDLALGLLGAAIIGGTVAAMAAQPPAVVASPAPVYVVPAPAPVYVVPPPPPVYVVPPPPPVVYAPVYAPPAVYAAPCCYYYRR